MNERDKELAEQANVLHTEFFDNEWEVKKFADLIRADEREVCANIVDKRLKTWASLAGKDKAYKWLEKIAVTIRARGNT